MEVTLTPELERFVDEKVRTGQFDSPADVISGALEVLRDIERFSQADLDELRREIAVGIEELDRGEGTPLDIEQMIADAHQRRANRPRSG